MENPKEKTESSIQELRTFVSHRRPSHAPTFYNTEYLEEDLGAAVLITYENRCWDIIP